jgi:predicted GIY-YIG superfamily endonuclease
VYRFFDGDDRLLYIGVTLDRDVRWANHAANRRWWPKVVRNTMTWFETYREAYQVERQAIPDEHPLFNEARYRTDHWRQAQG